MPAVLDEKTIQAPEGERKARTNKLGLLPTTSSEQEVKYMGKVIKETTWQSLKTKAIFSMSADGSHPYFKNSKSSFTDLVTGDTTTNVPPTNQQKVYQVKLL